MDISKKNTEKTVIKKGFSLPITTSKPPMPPVKSPKTDSKNNSK